MVERLRWLRDQTIKNLANLIDLANFHPDSIGDAVTRKFRFRARLLRRINRLDYKSRSLNIALRDPGIPECLDNSGHRSRISIHRLFDALGPGSHAAPNLCVVRYHADTAFSDHDHTSDRGGLCLLRRRLDSWDKSSRGCKKGSTG